MAAETGRLPERGRRGFGFVMVLLLALAVLLLVVLVAFNAPDRKFPFSDISLPALIPKDVLLQGDVGLVGGNSGSGFRHVYLGRVKLNSVRDVAPLAVDAGPDDIARGILTSQEREVSFNHESDDGPVTVYFKVEDTNGLGLLLLRLNGDLVWTGSPRAGEAMQVSLANKTGSFEAGPNVLQFSSTSSGWKIWSPSIYTLSSISVRPDTLNATSQAFPFALSRDEVSAFVLGRVVFTITRASPDSAILGIRINNATIWKGSPGAGTLPVVVDFSKSLSGVSDDNTISFGLEGEGDGLMEISSSEVIVFTSTSAKGTPAVSFTLSKDDIARMRAGSLKGALEFEISEISSPGPLQVALIGDRENILYEADAKAGKVRLFFRDGQAVFGQNTLVFRSTGSGVFRVGDLAVRLER